MAETFSVSSADGTSIGYERLGSGPALLAVHGGTANRTRWAPVAALLAEHYTLHLMDRRGRGLSGDGPDYSLRREAEDVAAVVEAIGGPVFVLGHSYGALCSLEAAQLTSAIAAMVLYEPPAATASTFAVDPSTLEELVSLVDAGEPERALERFYLRVIGVDEPALARMKQTPIWPVRIAATPALIRENREVNAYRIDKAPLAELRLPVRFLLGTETPAALRAPTFVAAAAIPGAEIVDLAGQGHVAIDTIPEEFTTLVRTFLT
ncbi:alpha/beta fold hydrolase [Fodinicola acaciae]|uniref:alpha/beta fold hydrolase n=1 Tax=Fodinicola acaciae TaxID=2681555 RepID=UPI0013D3F297|nr:alpha/beta hydrolase [Fodinicola acaciae]